MKPRILVVDDEPIVRNFVAAALRSCGYDVLITASGAEAAAIFGRERGAIHLLVTEFELPDRGGAALARRLRRSQPSLPVLYTTGQFYLDTAEPVLYKPFTTSLLLQAIAGQCCFHPKAA